MDEHECRRLPLNYYLKIAKEMCYDGDQGGASYSSLFVLTP